MAKVHDHNYYTTLIAVADDCPVESSSVPEPRGGKPTVATVQYEMLADAPFVHKMDDVLFHTWLVRQPEADRSEEEVAKLREEFFAKPKPCLRTSPLAKAYGWGFSFDPEGKVALCPMESGEYQGLLADDGVKKLKAMASEKK